MKGQYRCPSLSSHLPLVALLNRFPSHRTPTFPLQSKGQSVLAAHSAAGVEVGLEAEPEALFGPLVAVRAAWRQMETIPIWVAATAATSGSDPGAEPDHVKVAAAVARTKLHALETMQALATKLREDGSVSMP